MTATPKAFLGRSLARFMAVQALYAMDVGQVSIATVKEMMAMGQFGDGDEARELVDEDAVHFEKLVMGVTAEQKIVDEALREMLPKNWPINRIDATLRALLRAASFEILRMSHVPVHTVIDEYVEITHDFFDGDESRFVNGVLDGFIKKRSVS
jgi:transcription antitermination factor NusB